MRTERGPGGSSVPAPVTPLPMFPLQTVLFPHSLLPLHVFEPRYRSLVADCLAGSASLGIVLVSRGSEVGGGDERVAVGTLARIERALPVPDGRWFLVVEGRCRIRVTDWLGDDPYPKAAAELWPDDGEPVAAGTVDQAVALVRRASALGSELGRASPLPNDLAGELDPDALAWRLCDAAPLGAFDRQRLLEVEGRRRRLELLAALAGEAADDFGRLLAGA